VAEHKFRVDQRVTLAANVINRNAAGGSYVVTKQLPERDGEFEYRIKTASFRLAPKREKVAQLLAGHTVHFQYP